MIHRFNRDVRHPNVIELSRPRVAHPRPVPCSPSATTNGYRPALPPASTSHPGSTSTPRPGRDRWPHRSGRIDLAACPLVSTHHVFHVKRRPRICVRREAGSSGRGAGTDRGVRTDTQSGAGPVEPSTDQRHNAIPIPQSLPPTRRTSCSHALSRPHTQGAPAEVCGIRAMRSERERPKLRSPGLRSPDRRSAEVRVPEVQS